MRICKIWDSDYPWDVRVHKVASTLTAAGHDVHLIARNRRGLSVHEQLPEATIHRLAPYSWLPGAVDAAAMFPAFFNPRWISAIYHTASSERADLILVRDLPLAPTAVAVAQLLRIPVVLDMAENYAAMMQSLYDNGLQRRLDPIIRNPAIVRWIERWTMSRVDHTFVVVEESRDRLVAAGANPERITVVGNTPDISRLAVPTKRHSQSKPLRLIYLGLLEKPRGLEVVLHGMAMARASGVEVTLTVIGDGRERVAFEALAITLGLSEPIARFLGFVPNAKALEALRDADVGLVPHLANESWNTTIPNKLFDYMSSGLAVLSSDAKPAARVVRETGAGEVYPDRDPGAFAASVARLADAVHRSECGARGRRAVLDRFNFSYDGQRMLNALKTVLDEEK